jgi:hypothetical protein
MLIGHTSSFCPVSTGVFAERRPHPSNGNFFLKALKRLDRVSRRNGNVIFSLAAARRLLRIDRSDALNPVRKVDWSGQKYCAIVDGVASFSFWAAFWLFCSW